MAALLRNLLLKKPPPPPPLRFLASFDKPAFLDLDLDLDPSPFLRQSPLQRSPFVPPFPDAPAGGAPPPSLQVLYPAFPHCFLARPIDAALPDGSDSELDGGGEPTAVWADSVKKKRKKKMNKHKHSKLRKRLRRKTK